MNQYNTHVTTADGRVVFDTQSLEGWCTTGAKTHFIINSAFPPSPPGPFGLTMVDRNDRAQLRALLQQMAPRCFLSFFQSPAAGADDGFCLEIRQPNSAWRLIMQGLTVTVLLDDDASDDEAP